MWTLTSVICLLILAVAVDGQQAGSSPQPTPAPTPSPTSVNIVHVSSPPPTTQPSDPTTPQPGIANTPAPAPAMTTPAPAAADTNTIPTAAPTETDYPISRCGPIYTNEWCPPGSQGQTLYCSRWGFCAAGNKADEYAGMFIDINAPCTSLTDAECKTKNAQYFCYVPEMRCAIKVSHDQVQASPQQKSGTVATSISALAIVLLIAVRFAQI